MSPCLRCVSVVSPLCLRPCSATMDRFKIVSPHQTVGYFNLSLWFWLKLKKIFIWRSVVCGGSSLWPYLHTETWLCHLVNVKTPASKVVFVLCFVFSVTSFTQWNNIAQVHMKNLFRRWDVRAWSFVWPHLRKETTTISFMSEQFWLNPNFLFRFVPVWFEISFVRNKFESANKA